MSLRPPRFTIGDSVQMTGMLRLHYLGFVGQVVAIDETPLVPDYEIEIPGLGRRTFAERMSTGPASAANAPVML